MGSFMNKKNDKRLCWNCDGYVEFQLAQCPYCSVALTAPEAPLPAIQEAPASPYGDISVSPEEWKAAMSKSEETSEAEESKTKNETLAFLMLLPGVVFLLFGLALMVCAKDGILMLEWRESFAYFYILGAVPLLLLGWRTLR